MKCAAKTVDAPQVAQMVYSVVCVAHPAQKAGVKIPSSSYPFHFLAFLVLPLAWHVSHQEQVECPSAHFLVSLQISMLLLLLFCFLHFNQYSFLL